MKKIEVQYIDTQDYTAQISVDEWADDPTNDGNFSIVTFGRGKLVTDTDPDEYFTNNPEIKAELKSGQAFYLDIYQHSGTSYSLSGEGMQDRFDTANKAGIIRLDDYYVKDVSLADRRNYARQDLESYTAWANGYVYRVDVQDAQGEYVDGMSGFTDPDEAEQSVYDNFSNVPKENIKVTRDWE